MAASVRSFVPHEWPLYQALRLRALRDAPDAFGSTWADEQSLPDPWWRDRLRDALASGADLPLLAIVDGQTPAGLCWAKVAAGDAGRVQLFQMWVAPEQRGTGVGRKLLDAATTWARARGAHSLCLGVTLGDGAALRLYRAAGFEATGTHEALRPGSPLRVQPMCLSLL